MSDNEKYDTIIVGAGLAGASAALHLSLHQRVLLIEAAHAGAGASGVAGGLFNPFIAYRGRPVWRFPEAIASFHDQLERSNATHLLDNRGLLRPARDEQQATYYQQSIAAIPKPRHMVELRREPGTLSQNTRAVRYDVRQCRRCALSTKAVFPTHGRCRHPKRCNLSRQHPSDTWGITNGRPWVSLSTNQQVQAKRIVLALGYGYLDTGLDLLDLHPVKGQTLRIKWPAWLDREELPPTSGHAYIIPEKDTLAIGSSFEHDFDHEEISNEISLDLLNKADLVVPGLKESAIVEEQVGFRVTVPQIRLPWWARSNMAIASGCLRDLAPKACCWPHYWHRPCTATFSNQI